VTVNPGKSGRLNVMNDLGNAHCTVDVVGYFRTVAATKLAPVQPFRLMDTRNGIGGRRGALGVGAYVKLKARGVGTVPVTADTVVLSVTAVTPTAAGSVTVWTTGKVRPAVPTVQFLGAATSTNIAFVKVGADGTIQVINAKGATHVTVDVLGYFSSTSRGRFMPLPAARLFDTTPDTVAPLAAGGTKVVAVLGAHGVPATKVSAVVLNLAAHAPTANTSLVVFPYGTARPNVTNLSVQAGGHSSAFVVAKVGAGGKVIVRNAVGSVDVVADVVGYFTS
jgi:hypothetical protein